MKIIAKEFPGKEFASKRELFRALKKNSQVLIDMKKAAKFSDVTNASIITKEKEGAIKEVKIEDGKSLHVINTTKLLDSHNDLHINGIWNKSVKEKKGKIYFLVNHSLSVGSVIAYPKDVNIKLMALEWKDLGYDYEGETQALVFEIDKNAVRHEEAKFIIENGVEIEHSVRMAYVKVELAINSDDSDFKTEKAVWNKYYPTIVNKEVADERGYFWVVKEAKIVDEGSMVLKGSNHITPMLNSSKSDVELDIEDEDEENKDELNKDGIIAKRYPFCV